MKKYLFAAAMVTAIAAPAFADEVGVHVGPVGAGVTVGALRGVEPTREGATRAESGRPEASAGLAGIGDFWGASHGMPRGGRLMRPA